MVPPVLTWDVQGVKARVQTLPAASGFIMTKLGVTSVNESWGANLKRNQNFGPLLVWEVPLWSTYVGIS